MVKLKRGTHTAYSEASSLRLRAAWLYYNEGLTQKDVAEQLGISRTTVVLSTLGAMTAAATGACLRRCSTTVSLDA